MSPSALRKQTLKQLRATRRAMLSARWMLQLEDADDETRSEAALKLVQVNHSILKLENKRLSNIRDALIENEEALLAGTEALEEALDDVRNVKSVLSAAAGVLGVVGKAVSIL